MSSDMFSFKTTKNIETASSDSVSSKGTSTVKSVCQLQQRAVGTWRRAPADCNERSALGNSTMDHCHCKSISTHSDVISTALSLSVIAPGLRCQRLGCGHTYQRWHTRLYGPCPSNPQSHSALAFDPPRPQQAVPSQEPRRATTPVRSVHTPSPCDVERDAHFEQRMQDSLQFRTQDGNPVSVIMIYLGRGGYRTGEAQPSLSLREH